MEISTDFGLRAGTTRMPITFPIVTPSSVTGAPFFNPLALSKYVRSTSLGANSPPVDPDMRKMRAIRIATDSRTTAPTLSCDHWISFRLGTWLLWVNR